MPWPDRRRSLLLGGERSGDAAEPTATASRTTRSLAFGRALVATSVTHERPRRELVAGALTVNGRARAEEAAGVAARRRPPGASELVVLSAEGHQQHRRRPLGVPPVPGARRVPRVRRGWWRRHQGRVGPGRPRPSGSGSGSSDGRRDWPSWSRFGHGKFRTGPNRTARRVRADPRRPLLTRTSAHNATSAMTGE